MENKRTQKMETSKQLLYFTDTLVAIISVATIFIVILTRDTSPLSYLIPGVCGLATISHGFYYWKAKAENLKKFGLEDRINMDDGGNY